MSLRLRGFPDHGFLLWFALSVGLVAWVAHLLFMAAAVGLVRDDGAFWVFHVANAVCAVLAALGLALSWLVYRAGTDPEDAGSAAGRLRFLGALGLLLNGINLLLIVTEGAYIFFIPVGR